MLTGTDEKIIESMARTLFVCAWADAEENAGRSHGHGVNLMDVAPATPESAKAFALYLAGRIHEANGKSLLLLIFDAARADNYPHPEKYLEPEYVEDFGHCLAMQSLGHGVSWFDDHASFPLKVPQVEFYLDESELEAAETGDNQRRSNDR